MRDGAQLQRMMSCLAGSSRYRLVRQLLTGSRCVSDLAIEVGLSQSCTTRHLQALEREGMVSGKRDGKRVMFRVRDEEPQVRALIELALHGAPLAEAPRAARPARAPRAPARASRPARLVRRPAPREARARESTPRPDETEAQRPVQVPAQRPNEPRATLPAPQPEPEVTRVAPRPRRPELEDFLL